MVGVAMLPISNIFVLASRSATAPAVNEVFLDRTIAQERQRSFGSSVEVISLAEALRIFADNVRADESFVLEAINYR